MASAAPSGALPRAVTLDVWYTLLYLRPPDRRALEAARRSAWVDPLLSAGLTRAQADLAVRELVGWGAREEVAGSTPTVRAQSRWLSQRVHRPLPTEEIVTRLDSALLRAPVRVADDAMPALRRLDRDGVRLGIVSNVRFESSDAARGVLDSTGLLARVGTVVLSSDHPWSKPGPEPFRWCLQRLRVPPSSAVHVGDLAFDVVGARRAGLTPLLYTGLHRWESPRPRFRQGERPDLAFSRWSDAPRALRTAARLRASTSRPPRLWRGRRRRSSPGRRGGAARADGRARR